MGKAIINPVCALALVLGAAASPARADVFPAGIACSFTLETTELQPTKQQFRDAQGRTGVVLYTGQFGTLQFTNKDTGTSITLPGKGANYVATIDTKGNITGFTFTGHWVIIWYPTDISPVGPATIEYVGRLVVRVGPAPNFAGTLVSQEGRQVRDICAVLSG